MALELLHKTAAYVALIPPLGLVAIIAQSFVDDWRDGWRPWKREGT
ncbi:hypothetical protein [Nonomuraea sp. NPDC003709]